MNYVHVVVEININIVVVKTVNKWYKKSYYKALKCLYNKIFCIYNISLYIFERNGVFMELRDLYDENKIKTGKVIEKAQVITVGKYYLNKIKKTTEFNIY